MGLAQTGTGKTAAFVLPILQRLMVNPRRGIRALILAPTRELAEQINQVICELSYKTRLASMTIYGGTSMHLHMRKLRGGGPEIVVACPGRLIDYLRAGSVLLNSVEVLVLDEADQMFDMGFAPNINEIITYVPKNRQTLLFSATMPEEIKHFADKILSNPQLVYVAPDKPVATISHAAYYTGQDQKSLLILELLKQASGGSALIFTRTKQRAKRLSDVLKKAKVRAISLQGDMSQSKRRFALDSFKSGRAHVLVATDIVARGIDVADIGAVINFDMPDTPEAYTHRVGRTGRAGKQGQAYSIVTQEDLYMLRIIERKFGKKIEHRSIDGLTLPVPEHTGFQNEKNGRNNRSRNHKRRFSAQQQTGPRKDNKSRYKCTPRRNGRDSSRGQSNYRQQDCSNSL